MVHLIEISPSPRGLGQHLSHPPINPDLILSPEEVRSGFVCQMNSKKETFIFRAFEFLNLG